MYKQLDYARFVYGGTTAESKVLYVVHWGGVQVMCATLQPQYIHSSIRHKDAQYQCILHGLLQCTHTKVIT